MFVENLTIPIRLAAYPQSDYGHRRMTERTATIGVKATNPIGSGSNRED